MKVRLLVGRSGIGFSHARGEEVEVGEAEGQRMIAAGQAKAVEADPRADAVERAVKRGAGEVEKAVK